MLAIWSLVPLPNVYIRVTQTFIYIWNITLTLESSLSYAHSQSIPSHHGSNTCYYELVLSVPELHINGVIQYLLFCIRIFSLKIVFGIIETHTCTPMFTATLFIIARTWKQPRCPSTNEWIKKLWYIYTMEYYLAIKRNAFESVLMWWMNLEPII